MNIAARLEALKLDRAAHRIHDARKLDQNATERRDDLFDNRSERAIQRGADTGLARVAQWSRALEFFSKR